MANPNTPFGFRPTMRTFTGGSGTIQPTHKLAGYATALFINDAVTHAAAGTKPTLAVDAAITPLPPLPVAFLMLKLSALFLRYFCYF